MTQDAEPQPPPENAVERKRWPLIVRLVLAALALVVGIAAVLILSISVYFSGLQFFVQAPWWTISVVLALVTAVLALIAISRSSDVRAWLGFGEKGEKTGLDLVQVFAALMIPVVVAVGGYLFTENQNRNQRDAEERRAQAQQVADERRAQDDALEAYLDEMGTLIGDEKLLSSQDSQEDPNVRTVAQARTLNALSRLDGRHDGSVVQFLHDSKLIVPTEQGSKPVISLNGADLSDAVLRDADLSDANLSGAHLRGADLRNADLRNADLTGHALLSCANLSRVDLRGAQIGHGTNLMAADLSGAKLSELELQDVNLHSAVLAFAILRDAVLTGHTTLNDANLSGANLSGADLSKLENPIEQLTQEQFEQMKASQHGASSLDLADPMRRLTQKQTEQAEAHLSGADLSEFKESMRRLTKGQIEQAEGVSQDLDAERSTKLPSDLESPEAWSNPHLVQLQKEILAHREEEEVRLADREAQIKSQQEARQEQLEAKLEQRREQRGEQREALQALSPEELETYRESQREQREEQRVEQQEQREAQQEAQQEQQEAQQKAQQEAREALQVRDQSCGGDRGRVPPGPRIGENTGESKGALDEDSELPKSP